MGRRRSSSKGPRHHILSKEKVTVHIKYHDIEQKFTGDANQVWISISRFFREIVPSFSIIKKALITTDLENLIEECENLIGISPEGPVLLISKKMLTASEILILNLLTAFIANNLGHEKNFLTKQELQIALGKNAKITSTRLGELVREGLITKTEDGNYKISTFGIKQFQDEILLKIREKLEK